MKPKDIIKKYEVDRVEFKQELPANSLKYLKSVVAYANTSGGAVVIGIEDKTRVVKGVAADEVPIVCDQIANAISDAITPQILPDIHVEKVDGKNVIIAEVYPGPYRPYYIESLGKEKGTFIRVGGTSRAADAAVLRDLEFEGANMSFDAMAYVGAEYDEKAAEKLCRVIEKYIYEAQKVHREVTPNQLEHWGLLKRTDRKIVPTNAFMMLTDNPFPRIRVQCALFKGNDRVVFLDKREFNGPLYEQIDEADRFVLKHINLGAEIDGIVRKDIYELPTKSVREMIVNAVTHQNFLDSGSVQVAVYDNRVEVTSPGMLYGGLTLKEVLTGTSKTRNKVIAMVFAQMNIIEDWGTGIKRIFDGCREYGIADPEFIELGTNFRVNLYRPIGATAGIGRGATAEDFEEMIVGALQDGAVLSRKDIQRLTGLKDTVTKKLLIEMLTKKRIVREGNSVATKYRLL